MTCRAISLSTIIPPMDDAALAALMALLLRAPSSSWITGQTYPVNGGYSFTQ